MPEAYKLNPPFRADHVGSLKRPEELQRARERLLGVHDYDRNLGAHDNAELRAIEDRAVDDVVRLQEEVGLQSITDGEFRRRTWWTDFAVAFDGLEENTGGKPAITFKDAAGHERAIPAVALRAPIRWSKSVVAEPFRYLAARTKRTPKLTIPAPNALHYIIGGTPATTAVYADFAEFWEDLTAAYRAEIAHLYEAGCRYLQLDDTSVAFLCDESRQAEVRGWGHEPMALLEIYVDAMNRALANMPADMTVTMHICRGNASAHWGASGGYGPVAELLFNGVEVNGFFLEYDTERAGTFEPLRALPRDKVVVLGLVTTKLPKLEEEDGLMRRIEEAGTFAPLEQLAISPQCGFASNYIGNPITIDDERRKLELVVRVAEQVWGSA